jgi:hypothetical protein
VGEENPGAYQSHHRCNRLNHRKLPLRPGRTKRLRRCTVKKIQLSESKIRPSDDLLQQVV